MLSYFKWKHDHKEMVKYRERNFRNLEALIEIHNIIVEHPSEVRKEVMLMTLQMRLLNLKELFVISMVEI